VKLLKIYYETIAPKVYELVCWFEDVESQHTFCLKTTSETRIHDLGAILYGDVRFCLSPTPASSCGEVLARAKDKVFDLFCLASDNNDYEFWEILGTSLDKEGTK
jgi:hypothetical protein